VDTRKEDLRSEARRDTNMADTNRRSREV
jgi:hypothetical protein